MNKVCIIALTTSMVAASGAAGGEFGGSVEQEVYGPFDEPRQALDWAKANNLTDNNSDNGYTTFIVASITEPTNLVASEGQQQPAATHLTQ